GKCYAVLPPSAHPAGGCYEWKVPPLDEIPDIQVASSGLLREVSLSVRQPMQFSPELERAIDLTLPSGPGQRNKQVFHFVRRLKGILPATSAPEELRTYIREWHHRALPIINTKDFETTEADFFDAWVNAKWA